MTIRTVVPVAVAGVIFYMTPQYDIKERLAMAGVTGFLLWRNLDYAHLELEEATRSRLAADVDQFLSDNSPQPLRP